MLPEITGKTAQKFFDSLNLGKFSMLDVAEHIDRENNALKRSLAKIAHAVVSDPEGSEGRVDFDVKSFVEGMLLTYGILHFQAAINEKKDPDFVRPDNWWNGSEWFSD